MRAAARLRSRGRCRRATARATAHWAPVSLDSPGTSGAEATLTAKTDIALAVGLTMAAVLGGTPGWYAYLAGFLIWIDVIAIRLILAPTPPADANR